MPADAAAVSADLGQPGPELQQIVIVRMVREALLDHPSRCLKVAAVNEKPRQRLRVVQHVRSVLECHRQRLARLGVLPALGSELPDEVQQLLQQENSRRRQVPRLAPPARLTLARHQR